MDVSQNLLDTRASPIPQKKEDFLYKMSMDDILLVEFLSCFHCAFMDLV